MMAPDTDPAPQYNLVLTELPAFLECANFQQTQVRKQQLDRPTMVLPNRTPDNAAATVPCFDTFFVSSFG